MSKDWCDPSLSKREKYAAYLCSREWAVLKHAVHERSGGCCERERDGIRCTNDGDAVHHLNYLRVYHERLTDLAHWCDGCHAFEHDHSDIDPIEEQRRDAPTTISGDAVIASVVEMRNVLRGAYERTGESALLPVIKRADASLRALDTAYREVEHDEKRNK
jgi:hypothetical protein